VTTTMTNWAAKRNFMRVLVTGLWEMMNRHLTLVEESVKQRPNSRLTPVFVTPSESVLQLISET